MTKRKETYNIETMADACFILQYSNNADHNMMAANPHSHGVEKMLKTARAHVQARREAEQKAAQQVCAA
jgi:hypothetical protein